MTGSTFQKLLREVHGNESLRLQFQQHEIPTSETSEQLLLIYQLLFQNVDWLLFCDFFLMLFDFLKPKEFRNLNIAEIKCMLST